MELTLYPYNQSMVCSYELHRSPWCILTGKYHNPSTSVCLGKWSILAAIWSWKLSHNINETSLWGQKWWNHSTSMESELECKCSILLTYLHSGDVQKARVLSVLVYVLVCFSNKLLQAWESLTASSKSHVGIHNRQRECLHSSNSKTKHGHVVLSIVARVLFVSSGNGKPSRLNMFILGGDFDNKFSCICEGQLWRVHIACNVYIFLGKFCRRYWILENSYRTEIHYFHIPNNIIMVKGWIPNFFYKRLLAVN